ncbi:MAG: hypothetical protein ACHQC8_02250 [Solirubrobacterales bacterium]
MATYPPKLTLPYRVGKTWLEERTLAGDVAQLIHTVTIDTDQLSQGSRDRVTALAKRIDTLPFEFGDGLEVIGSAVDAGACIKDDDGQELHQAGPIVEKIGDLPELAEPTVSAETLLDAYEAWISRYLDLSLGAVASWIAHWATKLEANDKGRLPNGASQELWIHTIVYSDGETDRTVQIDGRSNLDLFYRASAAGQMFTRVKREVDEGDMDAALDIVGARTQLAGKLMDIGDLVAAYEQYCDRISNLAFARHWTRQRQRDGFELEMRRWTLEHGSERLKMGVADGYRMIPVYLNERIVAEVPGFYAHLPTKDDKHTWQPRTGPSEEALLLRRAVQDRLNRHAPPGAKPPLADIGWIKIPPLQMCDEHYAYSDDEWGNREDEIKGTPFEIIVVRDWLGRYTLMAAVYTETAEQPPNYLLLKHVLHPDAYGLEEMPLPPDGESIAANADFESFSLSSGDDDIPF